MNTFSYLRVLIALSFFIPAISMMDRTLLPGSQQEQSSAKSSIAPLSLTDDLKADNVGRLEILLSRISNFLSFRNALSNPSQRVNGPKLWLCDYKNLQIKLFEFAFLAAVIRNDLSGIEAAMQKKPSTKVLSCARVLALLHSHSQLIPALFDSEAAYIEGLQFLNSLKKYSQNEHLAETVLCIADFYLTIFMFQQLLTTHESKLQKFIEAGELVLIDYDEKNPRTGIYNALAKQKVLLEGPSELHLSLMEDMRKKIEQILGSPDDKNGVLRDLKTINNGSVEQIVQNIMQLGSAHNILAFILCKIFALISDLKPEVHTLVVKMLVKKLLQEGVAVAQRNPDLIDLLNANIDKIEERDLNTLMQNGFPANRSTKQAAQTAFSTGLVAPVKALLVGGIDPTTLLESSDLNSASIAVIRLIFNNVSVAGLTFNLQDGPHVIEIANLFLQSGARVIPQINGERCCFLLQYEKSNKSSISLLLADETLKIQQAAALGEYEKLQTLLQEKKPSQATLTEALSYATGQAQKSVIRLLLQAGADPKPAFDAVNGIILRCKFQKEAYADYEEIRTMLKRALPLKEQILLTSKERVKKALRCASLPADMREILAPGLREQIKACIDGQNGSALEALETAISSEYTDVIPQLIMRAHNDMYVSVLIPACVCGAWSVVKKLFEYGYGIDDNLKPNCLPLNYALVSAIGSKNFEMVVFILAQAKSRNNLQKVLEGHSSECYPLKNAVELDDIQIAEYIIEFAREEDLLLRILNGTFIEPNKTVINPLHTAVCCRNQAAVELLLRNGAHTRLLEGESSLAETYKRKDLAIFKLLVAHSANVHATDDIDGQTVLHHIVLADDTETANFLLQPASTQNEKCEKQASPLLLINHTNRDGDTPFYLACAPHRAGARAHLPMVTLLIDAAKRDVNVYQSLAETRHELGHRRYVPPLLMRLSKRGEIDCLKLLLASIKASALDSKINQKHRDKGYTALQLACKNGHTAVVELLLECGADPSSLSGTSGPSAAYASGKTALFNLLLTRGAPLDTTDTILHLVAEKTDLATARLIVSKKNIGSLINLPGKHGETPLIIACKKGSSELVRLFLENGTLVNQADADGNTPLIIAAREGHTQIVLLLLEAKANIGTRNKAGSDALKMALQLDRKNIVLLLKAKSRLASGLSLGGFF